MPRPLNTRPPAELETERGTDEALEFVEQEEEPQTEGHVQGQKVAEPDHRPEHDDLKRSQRIPRTRDQEGI